MLQARRAVVGAFLLACAACNAILGLEPVTLGAGGQGGQGGGGSGGGGGGGAGGSAPFGVQGPYLLAEVAGVAVPTGMAQQTHLVFSKGHYFLFTFDASLPDQVRPLASSDFLFWEDRPPIPLPAAHNGEGRNLSVALNPANEGVLHLTASVATGNDRRRVATRITVVGGQLAVEPAQQINQFNMLVVPTLNVDAPAAAVTTIGRPLGLSGFQLMGPSAGDSWVFWAVQEDTTAAWANSVWAPGMLAGAVSGDVGARAIATVGDDEALIFWDAANASPFPNNIQWAHSSPSGTGGGSPLFAEAQLDVNDWNVVAVSPTRVHAVRRSQTGFLSHRVYDSGTWNDAQAPATGLLLVGGGLALFASGDGVTLFGIVADNSVGALRFHSTTGQWDSEWTTLAPPSGNGRRGLSLGAGTPAGRAAVIWTEGPVDATQIHGLLVDLPG